MIVDTSCNNVGILVGRIRRISIEEDDLYFWTIHWMREAFAESTMPMTIQMEEEGLKISIVVGLYYLFSIEDESNI